MEGVLSFKQELSNLNACMQVAVNEKKICVAIVIDERNQQDETAANETCPRFVEV